MRALRSSICLTMITVILCGILYPLTLTLIGQLFFQQQANGSLIMYDHRVVGSKIVGQLWTGDYYFHGRPSAVDYNINPGKIYKTGVSSGGTNESNSNEKLMERVKQLIENDKGNIAVDAITSSGSGLDPHITVENARKQAQRIANARHISMTKVIDLINRNKRRGVLTYDYVNVLELNITLDKLKR
ncbi:K(+)-transporting ATPase subunit C [Staphylococcus schweitzeri]|uniref:Potassium-transporting ATPase KdpC subunit n=1 Tax=Staphylococcus schweitzeri TaxID=1654388 RepID=A0A2K4AEP8_9STAP|nr:K(+)-transporting ATPase subunit C [Staphylococcus schweitzeri]MBE2129906.1 K(+)-transporting ATPase subunit C [Staphylococcus schweitzeri]PNZ48572.1 K(+)-transporting ATPase subunit C [Staphylococcus schweitzeri]CDR54632.1 putative potassium-transporting ATPase C chain [Staphylococcus schweitzeri]VEE66532.1 potassium-transporting ATPase subunit C [Staphylococcus schweitzeri]